MANFPLLEPTSDVEFEDADEPTSPGNGRILLDIFRRDGRPFSSKIPDPDIKYIWTLFGGKTSDLKSFGQRIIPKRSVRITYKFRTSISLLDYLAAPQVQFTVDRSGRSNYYEGRFQSIVNLKETAEIGDTVKLTVVSAFPEVSLEKLENWLKFFGEIRESLTVSHDEEGIEVGNACCLIKLAHHLPEFLPIYGVKARIYYIGQPKQCSFCFRLGHVKRDCTYDRISFTEYAYRLQKTGNFKDAMFGSWIKSIEAKKRRRSPHDERPTKRRGNDNRKPDRREAYDGYDLRSHLKKKDLRGRLESNHTKGRYRGRSPSYDRNRDDRRNRWESYGSPRRGRSPTSPRSGRRPSPTPRVKSIIVEPSSRKRDRSTSRDDYHERTPYYTPRDAKRRYDDSSKSRRGSYDRN